MPPLALTTTTTTTIADYSYQVGKWHQGSAYRKWTPVGRGFDQSYGFLGGGEDHFTQQAGTCTYSAANTKQTVRGSVTDYWEETAGSPGRHITDCDIEAEAAPACPIYTVLNLNGSKADNIKRCAAGDFVNCAVPKALRGNASAAAGLAGGDPTADDVERHPDVFQCYQCKPVNDTGTTKTKTPVAIFLRDSVNPSTVTVCILRAHPHGA